MALSVQRPIGRQELATILALADDGTDFAALLTKRGFSTNLSDIEFSETLSLKSLRLKSLTFARCKFNSSHLSASQISSCRFEKCEFLNTALVNTGLYKSRFKECNFHEAMFVNAVLEDVTFDASSLQYCSFEDATISKSSFTNVAMLGTHFLGASVEQSRIRQTDLTDALFFEDKNFEIDAASSVTARVTRPTTVTLIHPEARGFSGPLIVRRLDGTANTIPVRIAAQSQRTTKEILGEEMQYCLTGTVSKQVPIPQQVVEAILENPRRYPAAAAIVAKARILAMQVDSIVLPGGEDIAPGLYGEEAAEKSMWDEDYRRSVLELGLIHEAVNKGIPLIGVCRGFHMIGVYFGAKLYQHIGSGQIGVQILGKAVKNSIYGSGMDDLHTAVCHHQAIRVDTGMDHLQASVTHAIPDENDAVRTVVMALEASHAATPIVGVQFHTEFFEPHALNSTACSNLHLRSIAGRHVLETPMDLVNSGILDYMSENNISFWKIVSDMAHQYWAKKMSNVRIPGATRKRLTPFEPV